MINHPDFPTRRERDKSEEKGKEEREWWQSVVGPDYVENNVNNSSKMLVLMEIIKQAVNLGEKILVFTFSLCTLDSIERLLNSIIFIIFIITFIFYLLLLKGELYPGSNKNWKINKHYLRIDGESGTSERHQQIRAFNNPSSSATVFLISTKVKKLQKPVILL